MYKRQQLVYGPVDVESQNAGQNVKIFLKFIESLYVWVFGVAVKVPGIFFVFNKITTSQKKFYFFA